MRKLLFFFIFLPFIFGFGQNLGVSPALLIGDNDGNYHPQIEVNQIHEPMVLWTSLANKAIYFSKKSSSEFSSPVQLNPAGLLVQAYNWSGADLAVENENVYIVFRSDGYETGHIYLLKSSDNGNSFSDTVRVDHLAEGYAQYPDIAVFNDTIFTTYMAHDGMGMNPQYVLSRSFDGGNSFENPISAGDITGDEACDCCQPEIIVNADVVIVLFRNNASNVRDIKGVVSYDRGDSFTEIIDVDSHNWTIQSCPSTGPDGRITNDNKLFTVYKSVEGTANKVFLNTSDAVSHTSLSNVDLSEGIANGANYPQMAMKNDTLAFVFEGIGTQTDVFFMHSYSGENGITVDNRVNITNAAGVQSKPDLAIDNNLFHVVYADNSDLKYVTLGENLSLDELKGENKVTGIIYSKENPNFSLDLKGKIIYSLSGEKLNLEEADLADLSCGTYFIVNEKAVQKLIIIP